MCRGTDLGGVAVGLDPSTVRGGLPVGEGTWGQRESDGPGLARGEQHFWLSRAGVTSPSKAAATLEINPSSSTLTLWNLTK